MKNIPRNYKILGAIAVLALMVLGGIAYSIHRNSQLTQVANPATDQTETIDMLPQDALSVKLAKGKASPYQLYTLTIDKIPQGAKTLSYNVQYETDSGSLQGFGGQGKELTSGQATYTNDEVFFGSCSKNKCTPDKGVHNVVIDIRFDMQDGTAKGWRGNLDLP